MTGTLVSTQITELASELYLAERGRTTLEPLTHRHTDMTMEDGYAVQAEYARLRQENDGARLVGMKVGATSVAIQEYFGIDQPDFGVLLNDMEVSAADSLQVGSLIQPRIEPEIAFILNRDLAGPGVTAADVMEATESIAPCIEVIDSRILDWEIALPDTVADNGSSARFVLGESIPSSEFPILRDIEVRFSRNDEEPLTAKGEAVLGDPANAVAWLANTLGELGSKLSAGQVVLSGSFTTALDCTVGDLFVADFGPVGSIGLHITA